MIRTIAEKYVDHISALENRINKTLTPEQFAIGQAAGILLKYSSSAEYIDVQKHKQQQYRDEIINGVEQLIRQYPILLHIDTTLEVAGVYLAAADMEKTKMSMFIERQDLITRGLDDDLPPTIISMQAIGKIPRVFDIRGQHCDVVANFVSFILIPMLKTTDRTIARNKGIRTLSQYVIQYEYS